ncbi:hypothetical protein BSKO_09850 [Bryopsis sp. KO-2023]|nr:hypothetical protein BSKO_09850 [Bryopsis sp. KO-2023]
MTIGQGPSPTVPIVPSTISGEGPGTVRVAQPVRGFMLPTGFSEGPSMAMVSRPKSFVGITKRSKTRRWEAHIWVPDKKQQIYLGNFSTDERAATAYDIAALKVRREGGRTNFPVARYTNMMGIIERFHLDDVVRLVRRQSQGFGRGKCCYRGVTKHSNGTWEARIGVPKKHRNIYIGLFDDTESAAKAYDEAMIRMKGAKMSANFLQNDYTKEIEEHSILTNVRAKKKIIMKNKVNK